MHGGPKSVRPRPPDVKLLHNMMALSQYTFVLAGAMDVGTLAAFIVIFLGLGLTSTRLSWGGNTIYTKTADWLGTPYRSAPVEGFGPTTGWT